MADLSQFSIYPATAEQIQESRMRTAVQWRRGLSMEQYLERDRIMDAYEQARDGKLITWCVYVAKGHVALMMKAQGIGT